jgi:hypothetical protein
MEEMHIPQANRGDGGPQVESGFFIFALGALIFLLIELGSDGDGWRREEREHLQRTNGHERPSNRDAGVCGSKRRAREMREWLKASRRRVRVANLTKRLSERS